MRNPDLTKKKILQESADLFNTQGYKATSIRDITNATQLTKGAIYRHFKNKEELESETLMYLSSIMFHTLRQQIKSKDTAPDKLRVICSYFRNYLSEPPIHGGCPLMNVSIEADDCHPNLRLQALNILDLLHHSLVSIIEKGKQYNQLKKDTDSQLYATLIIAALEGAIMMSKLRRDPVDIDRVVYHLESLISNLEI